jgi:squalene synthase HpnC
VTTLQEADRECRRLLRHYENFTVASRLAPRAVRRHLARLYAYCRTTDDLGDESPDRDTAVRRLHEWREMVEAMLRGEPAQHPVLVAFAETVRAANIPGDLPLRLIDANIQDQRVVSYQSFDELRAYCARSADPVGRMVLLLHGVGGEDAVRCSDDVCTGLQLANFVQDVSVDAAKGRTYLLQSEIAAHGVVGATRCMAQRAGELLQSGRELERMVRGRLRLQLALYRCGGEAILDAVARQRFDTRTRRPVVSRMARLQVLLRATAASVAPAHRSPAAQRRLAGDG